MHYTNDAALCDEHLMQSGLSGIKHTAGNRCLSLAKGKWVGHYGSRIVISSDLGKGLDVDSDSVLYGTWVSGGNAADCRDGDGGNDLVRKIMKAFIGEGECSQRFRQWTDFIPICKDGHFGVVVLSGDAPGKGSVRGEHSMHTSPPVDMLRTFQDVYEEMFNS